ncbi:MAG: anhydro-N-acetylmuramic acid kinase, partial [Algiphilus sp.]
MASPRLAMGLMSGTSADGIDAVILRVVPEGGMAIIGHHFLPYPDSLRKALLDFGNEEH